MNRRSLGIAGIFGALALACAIQANAAKGIRQDFGRLGLHAASLTPAGSANPCMDLPDVSFDPFGFGLTPSAMTDTNPDGVGDVYGNICKCELQYGMG